MLCRLHDRQVATELQSRGAAKLTKLSLWRHRQIGIRMQPPASTSSHHRQNPLLFWQRRIQLRPAADIQDGADKCWDASPFTPPSSVRSARFSPPQHPQAKPPIEKTGMFRHILKPYLHIRDMKQYITRLEDSHKGPLCTVQGSWPGRHPARLRWNCYRNTQIRWLPVNSF